MKTVVPCLAFQTEAKEVMDFYTTVFPKAKIISQLANPDYPELLAHGHLKLNDSSIYFVDIGPQDPAPMEMGVSLCVEMDSEEEFYRIFNLILADGVAIMGPEVVFDRKLMTWVIDKFSVTWQFVLN